jgi:HAD superfamily hydrolase (TIGR01450 family)
MNLTIKDDIFSLAEMYDAFFVDIYGVLYDGVDMFQGTLQTMERLRKIGKKIIILSNMTLIASDAKLGYAQRGMFEKVHYDEMITSGEFLRQTIINKGQEFTAMMETSTNSVKCMFMGNANVFADLYITKSDSYDDAGFVYVGVPRASYGSVRIDDLSDDNDNLVNIEDIVHKDWHSLKDSAGRRGPSEFARSLEVYLKKNKTILVANPDMFAHGSVDQCQKKVPIFTQGSIGRYYEKLGGKSVYFGKPYGGIFEYAKQYANPNDRIVMVGDAPWTDILGANAFGIDSAMVMTGVCDEFIHKMNPSLSQEEKIDILLTQVSKKMQAKEGSAVPSHIIRQFAHID